MNTATKSRLKVIKGGIWGRKLYSRGWRLEEDFRHFKYLRVVDEHWLDVLAIYELNDTGDIDKVYTELMCVFTNPYIPSDLVTQQDTLVMIARLYRAGLPIKDIARIMHHWYYRDYPFPSGGRNK